MAIPYNDMSISQVAEFLQTPRFATFGTNRANGPPQLTPVWFLHEKERLYVSMYKKSAKYRNLSRDPRVALCIAGTHPDARAVMVYGTVEFLEADSPGVDDIVWRLARRYYDSDEEARAYLEAEASGGENAIAAVTPEKIIAQDYN